MRQSATPFVGILPSLFSAHRANFLGHAGDSHHIHVAGFALHDSHLAGTPIAHVPAHSPELGVLHENKAHAGLPSHDDQSSNSLENDLRIAHSRTLVPERQLIRRR